MGKQSPKKRKSEVNSNESPKKAKVAADSPQTPVTSPVKQTPQKNKTPKSQKKQKPQSPAKKPITNGVANKTVQINEDTQGTPANTPAKKASDKKYPVTPAAKTNAGKTPKEKKSPAGTPNKEGKLKKFSGVKSLETSPANNEKKKRVVNVASQIPAELAEGLNKRQKKKLRAKLRKQSIIQTKKAKGQKDDGDTATNTSIQEIAENVAEGKTAEKSISKSQMRKMKKMQKLANAANAADATKPQNTVQSPKTKANKKKGKNTENKPQQTKANETAAVNINQAAQNKKKKGNKNPNKGNQMQQKQKVEVKQADSDSAEAMEVDESDYEVETVIKPQKVSKKMNETNDDVNEEPADEGSEEIDEDEEVEDGDEKQDVETDNSLNENNENEQKDQKKQKKQPNKSAKGKQVSPKDAGLLKKGQSRYVLFVGNLSYDVSKQEIKEHFGMNGPVKDVRIPPGKEGTKSRGFAYLEVPNEEAYHKALSLHHSFINGRRINVLYTQGGTKNTEHKKQTIKKKNFKLHAMRKEGTLPGGVKDSQKRSVRRAKQRYFDVDQE